MKIPQVNYSTKYNTEKQASVPFGHGGFWDESTYNTKDKAIVAGTSALGVMASLAVLAKLHKYSLNPAKMFKNIKNSYLAKVKFEAEPVVAMGIGTCLGGLAGGYIIDKDENNRKAKRREAVMQIGNISIPIYTVKYADMLAEKLKLGKVAKTTADLGAIVVGVYIANYLMNKVGNALFHNKNNERAVKVTDFSAHLDDFVLASTYIAPKSKIIHAIGRAIPLALMIPGSEIGNKKAN